MRLHRLTASAFGPFPETVEVDFDGLSQAGLFLIHGATGAGKTSLLDAICFALYAAVPGQRPSGRALRSDHARVDAVPRVSLEFTASGRRLRVVRSPEFLRPKKRGVGETSTQASVTLHELVDSRWVALGTRSDEVGLVIRDVLGMGLEQFSKVVLLPQGDFAAFLRSTPEERRCVLERLFDVSGYSGIESWLADQRRAGAAAVERGLSEFVTDLARLADVVARVPDVVAKIPDLPKAGIADWTARALSDLPRDLAEVGLQINAHATETLAAFDAASVEDDEAAAHCALAARLADLQRRAARARADLAELEARSDAYEAARERLAAAERALRCVGDLRALQRADADLAVARDELARAEDAVAALGLGAAGSFELGHASLQDLRRHEDVFREGQQLVRAMSARGGRIEVLDGRIDEGERELAALDLELRRLSELSRASTQELASLQVKVDELDVLRSTLVGLESLLDKHRELSAVAAELVRLRRSLTAIRSREQDAREILLDLRQARLDEMAGELAEQLLDGEACPVCGSADHPRPGARSRTVTAADVTAAEQRWQALRGALDAAQQEQAALEQHRRTRSQDLQDEPRGVDELERALLTARSELRHGLVVAGRRDSMVKAADDANRAFANVAAKRAELQGALVASSAKRDELAMAQDFDEAAFAVLLGRHASRCPCRVGASGGCEALAEARGRHELVVRATTEQLTALDAMGQAADRHDTALAETMKTLQAQGFRSADQAERARLADAERSEVRRVLKTLDDQRAAAEATLADPEVLDAATQPAPDLDALDRVAERARATQLQAREHQARADQADREFRKLVARIADRVAVLGPAIATQERLSRLSDTVSGLGPDNTLRMRLSSYVLASRLEKVAELANERLAVMGEGRYRLQHSDGLAAAGRRSGLGLLVQDLWTGRTRDTATLSGGESFMASLALALGLAHAVREEAGGFDLQTLFIDEGFGTLDDQSLEQVMSVLDDLRDGGRAVGVVSHVSDLRSRIPVQVSVDKGPGGSTVRVLGADSPAA